MLFFWRVHNSYFCCMVFHRLFFHTFDYIIFCIIFLVFCLILRHFLEHFLSLVPLFFLLSFLLLWFLDFPLLKISKAFLRLQLVFLIVFRVFFQIIRKAVFFLKILEQFRVLLPWIKAFIRFCLSDVLGRNFWLFTSIWYYQRYWEDFMITSWLLLLG